MIVLRGLCGDEDKKNWRNKAETYKKGRGDLNHD